MDLKNEISPASFTTSSDVMSLGLTTCISIIRGKSFLFLLMFDISMISYQMKNAIIEKRDHFHYFPFSFDQRTHIKALNPDENEKERIKRAAGEYQL